MEKEQFRILFQDRSLNETSIINDYNKLTKDFDKLKIDNNELYFKYQQLIEKCNI